LPETLAESTYRKLLACDKSDSRALHAQLTANIVLSIESLALLPGQHLPSSRELARILGVSRRTVVRSYEDLLSQGFLKSVDGIGTFVRHRAADAPRESDGETRDIKLSDYARRLMGIQPTILASQHIPQINYGAPPPELLPTRQWRQIMLRHCREHDLSSLDYDSEPFGYRPLREAIASFLARFRGLKCSAEQVIVFVDAIYPLALVARLLLNEGQRVVMEEPGYPYARLSFNVLGAEVVPTPADENGMQVERLVEQNERADIVFVVPSHHDPLGGALSLDRRKGLLQWAHSCGAMVIEDDWECEFSYGGSPLPTLFALDKTGSVVYVSKFYKVLFPLSNVGFVVIPRKLIPVFQRAKQLLQSDVSTRLSLQDHYGLTAFLDEGVLERHIRKVQAEYALRRQAFIAAFNKHLRNLAVLNPVSAAMHFAVRFKEPVDENVICALAAKSELPVVPTRPYYMLEPVAGEFMFSFAQVKADVMDARVEKFKGLLGADRASKM
jgi:GntR family transcriptional regulator/MocR family aminotransferase